MSLHSIGSSGTNSPRTSSPLRTIRSDTAIEEIKKQTGFEDHHIELSTSAPPIRRHSKHHQPFPLSAESLPPLPESPEVPTKSSVLSRLSSKKMGRKPRKPLSNAPDDSAVLVSPKKKKSWTHGEKIFKKRDSSEHIPTLAISSQSSEESSRQITPRTHEEDSEEKLPIVLSKKSTSAKGRRAEARAPSSLNTSREASPSRSDALRKILSSNALPRFTLPTKNTLKKQLPDPFKVNNQGMVEGGLTRTAIDQGDHPKIPDFLKDISKKQLESNTYIPIIAGDDRREVRVGKDCAEDFFRLSYEIGGYKSAEDRTKFREKNPDATSEEVKDYMQSQIWWRLVELVGSEEIATILSSLLNQGPFVNIIQLPVKGCAFRYHSALGKAPPFGQEGKIVSYVKTEPGQRVAYTKEGLGGYPICIKPAEEGEKFLLVEYMYAEPVNQIENLATGVRTDLEGLGPYGALLVRHDIKFYIDLEALSQEYITQEPQDWIIPLPITVTVKGGVYDKEDQDLENLPQ